MLELLPESDDTVIGIRAAGVLTMAEQDALFPTLEEVLERHGNPLRLLLDLADATAMEKGVKSEALWFDMRYWPRIVRVAVVCDETWEDEVVRMADIFKAAQVRHFRPVHRASAWEWLRGE